jgi:hypothetical protein
VHVTRWIVILTVARIVGPVRGIITFEKHLKLDKSSGIDLNQLISVQLKLLN